MGIILFYDVVLQSFNFFGCRIQLGQPATVKVSANLVRLLSYQNKVVSSSLLSFYWDFVLYIILNLDKDNGQSSFTVDL